MKPTLLSKAQKTDLELAQFGAFSKRGKETRSSNWLANRGLLTYRQTGNVSHYSITPKGRIWLRRLGLMFLTNEA